MTLRGCAFLLIAWTSAVAWPQDPSDPKQDPSDPKKEDPAKAKAKAEAEEREKKAQTLLDDSKKLEDESKFPEAQTKLQELRARYRITKVYLDNYKEVANRLISLGYRIAATALKKQGLCPKNKMHMDSWHGVEFLPPENWRGVPPEQLDFGNRDMSEVKFKGDVKRITRYTARYLENLYLEAFKYYAPESLDDLTTHVVQFFEDRYKGLNEVSSGPFQTAHGPCLRKLYKTNDGDQIVMYFFYVDKKGFALTGSWTTRALSTGGIVFFSETEKHPVPDDDFKLALTLFDGAAKTFWVYDSNNLMARRQQLNWGSRCSDWGVLDTANYHIEYATSKEFAQQLGTEMEQIMMLYKTLINMGRNVTTRCLIKVFDCEEDFLYYGHTYGAAAYWSPSQEEIVCYRFSGDKLKLDTDEEMTVAQDKEPEKVTFNVIYHEGFHQYMYYLMGRDRGVKVPSWLNEGMGDVFFGGRWVTKGGKKSFEIGLNDWRLKTIVEAVTEKKHVPVERLLRYTKQQYYTDAGLCYAEGWALNYFFCLSDTGKKKGYNQIPARMFQELLLSGQWEKATDKCFAGLDLKKMDQEFCDFVMSLKKGEPKKDNLKKP